MYGKSCYSGRREGLKMFMHSKMRNEDGERGGWMKKSFFPDLKKSRVRVGYTSTKVERSRSRRETTETFQSIN